MIPDSSNPRVLADNIKTLEAQIAAGGGGTVLPDITPADFGAYLAVDELGKWGLDIPKTGIDYKTTEQNTGLKWIDGKDIFQITIETPVYTNESNSYSLNDLNIDNVVDYNNMIKYLDENNESGIYQNRVLILYNNALIQSYSINTSIDLNNNVLFSRRGSSIINYSITSTILYTKKTETKKTKKSIK